MRNDNSTSTTLSVVERVKDILELEPEKRLGAILDAPDPEALAGGLPPQELWITIKRIGEADTVELLELANDEQLIFIQDVECWIGDKLDPPRALKWLKHLLACGNEKVAQWLRTVDPDLFITMMRAFMIVTKPDEGTDPHEFSDTLPPYTIDGTYYLHFFGDEEREVVSQILQIFAYLRTEVFFRLMEAVIWESGTEVEEQARQFLKGRLRDFGIPDFEEAMVIYQFLDEKTFAALPEKINPMAPVVGYPAPNFPLAIPGKRIFLTDVLASIPDGEILDGIAMEIAQLANRLIVADSLDLSDAEHLTRAVSKVRAILSMGLEVLSGHDLEKAAELLRGRWLLHIFQVGYAQTLKLFRRADRIYNTGWLKRARSGKQLLGHPLENILDGLHRPRPLWYIGGSEPYRFFDNLEEVITANAALDRIEYLGSLFFDRIELLDPDPHSRAWKRIYPIEINFETVLRTALANAAAGRGFKFQPLAKADLKQFIENAFKPSSGKKGSKDQPPESRKLKPDVEKDLIAYLASKGTAKNSIERKIRDQLVRSSLQFLEEEMGNLDPEKLEPKYVQGLVIRK